MRPIPRKVDVFGIPYSVHIVGEDSKELDGKYLGRVVYVDRAIYINKGAPADVRRETFLHEYLHALLYVGGVMDILDGKVMEALCNCVGNGMRQFVFGGK